MDKHRPTGIPRLQPTGLPGKPKSDGVGHRFTTARSGAVYSRNPSRKSSIGGETGVGQKFVATRQPKVP